MMKASCGAGCLDAEVPIRISFTKLYQWPEADVEFLKLMTKNEGSPSSPASSSGSSRSGYSCHESYVCRQRYLRSYTFTRKESVAERSKRWFKEKQKVNKKSKNRCGGGGNCSCCYVFGPIFRFFFSCMAKVDVHEF